jgi:hypothetical protein
MPVPVPVPVLGPVLETERSICAGRVRPTHAALCPGIGIGMALRRHCATSQPVPGPPARTLAKLAAGTFPLAIPGGVRAAMALMGQRE